MNEKIEGSGSGYYAGGVNTEKYHERINTPAKSPEYFERFHKPMIERVKARFPERPITVLDIACGPASELDFLKDDTDVRVIASDISPDILPEVKKRLREDSLLFAADASHSPIKNESIEAGMLVNAVVYVPDKMLETMHSALKSGGECAVNFRIFSNEHNHAFYEYYTARGGVILENELRVQDGDTWKTFPLKVLDYRNYTGADDADTKQIRQLGQQSYFVSAADAEELARIKGFEVIEHSLFNFASPVNKNNQVDVFVLKKSSV